MVPVADTTLGVTAVVAADLLPSPTADCFGFGLVKLSIWSESEGRASSSCAELFCERRCSADRRRSSTVVPDSSIVGCREGSIWVVEPILALFKSWEKLWTKSGLEQEKISAPWPWLGGAFVASGVKRNRLG